MSNVLPTPDAPTVVRHATHAVLTVTGSLELDGRERLRSAFEMLLDEGCYRIVVDVSQLTFCDSTGLGILVAARKRAVAHGGWLRLTVPRTPQVRRVFALTGLSRLFSFYPTVAQASADLRPSIQPGAARLEPGSAPAHHPGPGSPGSSS